MDLAGRGSPFLADTLTRACAYSCIRSFQKHFLGRPSPLSGQSGISAWRAIERAAALDPSPGCVPRSRYIWKERVWVGRCSYSARPWGQAAPRGASRSQQRWHPKTPMWGRALEYGGE